MAILTELSKESITQLCAERSLVAARFEGVRAGSVNTNYALWTPSGERYFARVFEEQDLAGAKRETERAARLSQLGVRLPVALLTEGGERVTELCGKPAAIYPFIDGTMRCQKSVSDSDTFAVGAALARVHDAVLRAPDRASFAEGNRFDLQAIAARLNGLAEKRLEAGLADDVKTLAEEARTLAGLPCRAPELPLIHGDLFRDNVLFDDADVNKPSLWLLDFESASRGTASFDLAVALLAWCYGDTLELNLMAALLRGYESARKLEHDEQEDLPRAARFACLRFATTRITDYELRPAGAIVKKDYRRWLQRRAAILDLGDRLPEMLRSGAP